MSLYAIFSGKSMNKPMPSFGSLKFSKYLITTTSDLKEANHIFDDVFKERRSLWLQLVCLNSNEVIRSCISYDISKPVFHDYLDD